MGNKYKVWKKAHNRNTHRGTHSHDGGSIGDQYNKAPKFYRKEENKRNQRLFAELLKHIFKKKG